MEKKLLNEAKNEFVYVSDEFQFFYNVQSNLGDISLEQENYNQAIRYFNKLEKLSESGDADFKKSGIHHNLGLCYFHLQQYKQAEEYLVKGAVLQDKNKRHLRPNCFLHGHREPLLRTIPGCIGHSLF